MPHSLFRSSSSSPACTRPHSPTTRIRPYHSLRFDFASAVAPSASLSLSRAAKPALSHHPSSPAVLSHSTPPPRPHKPPPSPTRVPTRPTNSPANPSVPVRPTRTQSDPALRLSPPSPGPTTPTTSSHSSKALQTGEDLFEKAKAEELKGNLPQAVQYYQSAFEQLSRGIHGTTVFLMYHSLSHERHQMQREERKRGRLE